MRKRIYEKPLSTTIDIETAPLMSSSDTTNGIKAYNDVVNYGDEEDSDYGVQF